MSGGGCVPEKETEVNTRRTDKEAGRQEKKVITSGSLPDGVSDLFAEALVEFIMAIEQEEKEKGKSA